MGSRQEGLDVFVIRVQDHEYRWHLLVQVLHHGQRHRLHQLVPGEGDHVEVGLRMTLAFLRLFHQPNVAVVVEKDDCKVGLKFFLAIKFDCISKRYCFIFRFEGYYL